MNALDPAEIEAWQAKTLAAIDVALPASPQDIRSVDKLEREVLIPEDTEETPAPL